MGLRLKIEGSESIYLPETSIMTVKFAGEFPMDAIGESRI